MPVQQASTMRADTTVVNSQVALPPPCNRSYTHRPELLVAVELHGGYASEQHYLIYRRITPPRAACCGSRDLHDPAVLTEGVGLQERLDLRSHDNERLSVEIQGRFRGALPVAQDLTMSPDQLGHLLVNVV